MELAPWVAVMATVAAVTHYKWLLNRLALDSRTVLTILFLFLFGLSSLLLPWFGGVDEAFFNPRYLILFGFFVCLGIVQNYFLTRGLRQNSLHEFELIDILLPVFTIGLAALVFENEREPIRLTLGLFAALSFFVTHVRQRHLLVKQADRWLVYAIFLVAIERLLVKPLLFLATPVSLYTFRAGFIALAMVVMFHRYLERISWRQAGIIGLNALLGVSAMLATWVTIATYGLVVTEIYLLLIPIGLALVSLIGWHEHWSLRQVLAFTVILVCVGLVSILS